MIRQGPWNGIGLTLRSCSTASWTDHHHSRNHRSHLRHIHRGRHHQSSPHRSSSSERCVLSDRTCSTRCPHFSCSRWCSPARYGRSRRLQIISDLAPITETSQCTLVALLLSSRLRRAFEALVAGLIAVEADYGVLSWTLCCFMCRVTAYSSISLFELKVVNQSIKGTYNCSMRVRGQRPQID